MGTCGDIVFTITQADGSPLPSALTEVNGWLKLKTSDPT